MGAFRTGAACACALAVTTAVASGVPIGLPAAGSELFAPSRRCYAKVLEDARGGMLRARLYARERLVVEMRGAREMAWAGETLVFALSPASGRPGIYAWECGRSSVRRVVRPTRASLAHPGGSDLYQLVEIDGDVLYYAHAPDVDSPSLDADLERGIETLRLASPRPRLSMN
jgi:hypothetical protein